MFTEIDNFQHFGVSFFMVFFFFFSLIYFLDKNVKLVFVLSLMYSLGIGATKELFDYPKYVQLKGYEFAGKFALSDMSYNCFGSLSALLLIYCIWFLAQELQERKSTFI